MSPVQSPGFALTPLIDRDCVRDTITRVEHDACCTSRGVQEAWMATYIAGELKVLNLILFSVGLEIN